MPNKRRQRSKLKAKNVKKKGAPSEDMDSQSTQDSENEDESATRDMSIVLNRLSKKHLLNSSSEASDHAHKENIPVRLGDPYDADLETTDATSTAGESDMEFTSSHNKGILSPSRRVNQRMTRRGAKGQKLSHKKAENRANDSMSNIDSSVCLDASLKHCFPKLYASDASTPQSAASESKTELNDSAFGFESLASKELPFSPVPMYTPDNHQHSVSSATSDISSIPSSQVSASMSLSRSERHGQQKRSYTVNLSCLVDGDDGKKKTKRKKTGHLAKKEQMEDWAFKVGADFNDIEMYELSVE